MICMFCMQKGEKMKKVCLFAMIGVMSATTANAGWFDGLFGTKKEPATLEEACDTAEIKKVCPEVILGTKTVTECLSENIKSLSKQCATYVKKSVVAKKDAVAEAVAASKADSAAQGEAAKSELAAKVASVKEAAAVKKADAAAKAQADKEAAAAKKAAAKAAAKEIADAAHQVGQDAKDTGAAIKSLF